MDWGWYTDIKTAHLFIHCLLKANFKDKEWLDLTVERGSFVTSIAHLSDETGLSAREVRTALDKLEKTKCLTKCSTSRYTIITVLNYDEYQSDDKADDIQETSKRQTNDKRATTTKKYKNDNKEKNLSFDINEFFGSDFSLDDDVADSR